MLKDIEAVIFDLDGTLVDSMWMWRQIDIDYLKRFNIELPDRLQEDIEGMSFSETAVYFKQRFKIEDSLDKIKRDWNEMAIDFYRTKVGFKQGAYEFLKYLKENNIKTGIATSNSITLLDTVIDSLKVRDMFDSLHVSCEVKQGKPAPDIYLLVANDLNVSPDKCLVFEDITQGAIAGKTAGMKVCGIKDDFAISLNDPLPETADYYINDYFDILDNIN